MTVLVSNVVKKMSGLNKNTL